ncbi:adenylyl-sulfate kinase [Neobacillus mesonae]|uniref:adenylyl-sulfate kinase n=1 Tax=Neobacillus mesonae TaxID=1193713 RepID=UPI002E1FF6FE|nr:adenylyl-sulfate kinase [Neobacillus mesonae]MED4207564.1 adenylyl-sulfate kinase [Neobacillus mesonae]
MGSKNITWHNGKISKKLRQEKYGHKSAVLWFTGLSGSGKSTLAVDVESRLFQKNIQTYHLDGDNVRFGLNKDLGFSKTDRIENIRRIGEVAKLFVDSGQILLASFISPYKIDRESVRNLFEEQEFIEIYVKCDLTECEKRDPKGLYKKARNGEIKGFTGIDDPYEVPENPELVVETDKMTLEECTKKIIRYLQEKHYIK